MARRFYFQGHLYGRQSYLNSLIALVMVQNFDRISDSIKEQKAAELKQKKFNKLRQKLNVELAVQNDIQKSMQVVGARLHVVLI